MLNNTQLANTSVERFVIEGCLYWISYDYIPFEEHMLQMSEIFRCENVARYNINVHLGQNFF